MIILLWFGFANLEKAYKEEIKAMEDSDLHHQLKWDARYKILDRKHRREAARVAFAFVVLFCGLAWGCVHLYVKVWGV